jgi:hypothetical protein
MRVLVSDAALVLSMPLNLRVEAESPVQVGKIGPAQMSGHTILFKDNRQHY